MRSKMTKKLIAFLLCMVLVICNSVSILADTPAPEAVSTQQVKETKAAPEVETTTKKEETTEATTEKKEKPTEAAEETTTETKEGNTKATTEVAEETTTETKEKSTETTTEVKEDNTKATTEEATTEETSETSEKDKKENKEATTTEGKEETVPAELTFENDDVIVTVSEVAEGAIPEGAELKVVPILKDDTETKEQYTEVEKQIQEKAAETETEIKGFLAYDITFVDEDGNEIEPNSEVKVSMKYKQAAIPEEITAEDAKDAEVSVMHLEENADGNVEKVVDMGEAGKVDTLETTDENKVEKVEVKTESFSAYTIIWYDRVQERDRVTIHYVDVNGNSLDDKVSGENSYKFGTDEQIELENSKYNVTISGYEYRYSTVAKNYKSAPGNTNIYRLRLKKSNYHYDIQYQCTEDYGNGWESFEDDEAVYMVYSVDSSGGGSTGGGSSATGNLAHQKQVEYKGNGTYDLTLNVTGAVGTEANPAQVDIVFVLDLSGSMLGDNIADAKEAANTLIDTLANNETVDAKWKLVTFNSSATIETNT